MQIKSLFRFQADMAMDTGTVADMAMVTVTVTVMVVSDSLSPYSFRYLWVLTPPQVVMDMDTATATEVTIETLKSFLLSFIEVLSWYVSFPLMPNK